MPSEHQANQGPDREHFPRLKAEHGEDPARFLDAPITTDDDQKRLIKARIRGIDKISVVRAWKAVERNPDVGPQEQPREGVMRLLDHREEWLEEHGERPDRLAHGPHRPPEWFDSTSDVEQRDQRTASERLGQSVATDGGEQR